MGSRMSGMLSWAIVEPSVNSTIECTTDCGMHDDLDPVVGDAEQLVGLDDLQALVHQRARIDGDLRAHLPRRVGQSLIDTDLGELGGRSATERSAAGSQHDPGDLAIGLSAGSQALMHRAVLAVDGHEFCAGDRAKWLHDRRTGDEALLVGQRQPFARLQACAP